jgi:hypothetical protein
VVDYAYNGIAKIHMGQLLERVIRRTGLNVTDIALALDASRRTVYTWFTMEVIDESITGRISDIIRHDFSSVNPKATIIRFEAYEFYLLKDDK